MSELPIFDWAAERIVELSQLNALQARGTIRLLVKEAGLSVESLTAKQWQVVATKLLPRALAARGVADAANVAAALAACPPEIALAAEQTYDRSPEAILRRLAGKS